MSVRRSNADSSLDLTTNPNYLPSTNDETLEILR